MREVVTGASSMQVNSNNLLNIGGLLRANADINIDFVFYQKKQLHEFLAMRGMYPACQDSCRLFSLLSARIHSVLSLYFFYNQGVDKLFYLFYNILVTRN